MQQCTYRFGYDRAATCLDKGILGGKGVGLALMSSLRLPVPPGFTISTEVCCEYYKTLTLPDFVWDKVQQEILFLQAQVGRKFGGSDNPLLISVRSGARASMPGMMDTVLNLGLNETTTEALADMTQNKRFAYDSYRRFIEMYAAVVMNLDRHLFESHLSYIKQQNNVSQDCELSVDALREVIAAYQGIIAEHSSELLPQDVWQQLRSAVCAVFESWHSARAVKYRALHDIPENWGTAVNIQAMVFGNLDNDSCTGVVFTRSPSEGDNELFGEFLVNAQGEDLVSGVRTAHQITLQSKHMVGSSDAALEELRPETFKELQAAAAQLESHFADMQDIEFTVEKGKLWLLQTRSGKRTAKAAVKIAVDMLDEGVIDSATALRRVSAADIERLLHDSIDETSFFEILARGLPASPGAASGAIVLRSADAERLSKTQKVILVRKETSPEDIGGMAAAQGILTARGGMTSHAAVVARGMGKPCVCGAAEVVIDESKSLVSIGGVELQAGDIITINGATGDIIRGEVATKKQASFPEFVKLMEIADSVRKISVRANADTVKDVNYAREFGAEGIGLCRTEHMFFTPEKIALMRQMILASGKEERMRALEELFHFQVHDFLGIFQVMNDLPVTIRLLDPPLHEFLPVLSQDMEELARRSSLDASVIRERVSQLEEINPMLGHRGVRLAMTFPEIYEMQIRAIFKAAAESEAAPEIMVPFVFDVAEVAILKEMVTKVHCDYSSVRYSFGVMIELPRAALQAHKIAPLIDFCSFGTNDLTQTTLGISRDDANKFLPAYLEQKIFAKDPFVSLDIPGVGELVSIAISKMKAANPQVKIGVCGEHGGDPASIAFFANAGVDYVSCSPYRVPVARFAASIAALGA